MTAPNDQPIHCQNCKHDNPPGSNFCNKCGSALYAQRDPNRVVYNVFIRSSGSTTPWNLAFNRAKSFEEIGKLRLADYGSDAVDAYVGGYAADDVGDMTLLLTIWRRILSDGTLGDNEGPQNIALTNLG